MKQQLFTEIRKKSTASNLANSKAIAKLIHCQLPELVLSVRYSFFIQIA